MKFTNNTISMHYITSICNQLDKRQYDTKQALSSSKINTENSPRITPESFSLFLRSVWLETEDEFFGYTENACKPGAFKMMVKQAINNKDLRSSIYHLINFYSLITEDIELNLIENNELAILTLNINKSTSGEDYTLHEFLLMSFHRFLSWVIGRKIDLKSVNFAFEKPEHFREHNLLFPYFINYSTPDFSLEFDKNLLESPVVQSKETAKDYLSESPLCWLKKQIFSKNFTKKTINSLQSKENLKNICMSEVASELNMTSRNLRRKLKSEGNSFQAIKDNIRKESSITYLIHTEMPISLISDQLGFSEPSAFTRAFKKWTGSNPSEFR